MARDNSFPFHGFQVDSDEEVMTLLYLFELQEKGYIEKIERSESFTLSERFDKLYTETKQLKTKTKSVEKNQCLLREHVYTPEFKITWTHKGYLYLTWSKYHTGKIDTNLFHTAGKYLSYIEVKPSFDKHGMTRLFIINQKMMYKIYGIFVNLVIPHELFKETFTPEAWLLTPTGRERKINWIVKNINHYIEKLNKNNDIQNIESTDTRILPELGNESVIVENIN